MQINLTDSVERTTRHPLLKKFRTQNNYYIYDGKSNRILRVTAAMYDIIDLFGHKGEEEIVSTFADRHPLEEIRRGLSTLETISKSCGLFTPGPLRRRAGYVTREEVVERLKEGIKSLTLEVTEACNLRCRYCIFSGGYANWRSHGHRRMSEATALAAIDLYLKNSRNSDTVMIGFYGGEPLLNFGLIRRCCDYVKSREREDGRHRDIHFSLTTNGTLLTDDKLEYLIRNNFSVSFSLDGPQEIHDRYRVFADGQGTFEFVFPIIQRIYREYPRYFNEKILFNCTITPTANLKSLTAFFGRYHHLFTGGKLNLVSLAPGNPDFLQKNPTYNERDEDWADLYRLYCAAHVHGVSNPDVINPFIRAAFERNHLVIYKRPMLDQATDQLGRINSCFPGARKLFVDVQGTLHICERIDRYFPIGTVSSGFDVDKITTLMNAFIGIMDSDTCRSCWAVQMCNVCYNDGKEGIFSETAIYERCARYREELAGQLQAHCSILEKNPSAFDYMESYEMA